MGCVQEITVGVTQSYRFNLKRSSSDEVRIAVSCKNGLELHSFINGALGILKKFGYQSSELTSWKICAHGRWFENISWGDVRYKGRSYRTACQDCLLEQRGQNRPECRRQDTWSRTRALVPTYRPTASSPPTTCSAHRICRQDTGLDPMPETEKSGDEIVCRRIATGS